MSIIITIYISICMQRANLLIQIYSGIVNATSTQQIKASEIALESIINTQQFIHINLHIINTPTIAIQIRTLAAISLAKATKSSENIQGVQDQVKMFQDLMNLVSSPLLQYQLKTLVMQSIENYISHPSMKVLKGNLIKQLELSLKEVLSKQNQQINYQFLVYFGHALFNKSTSEEESIFLISNTLSEYAFLAQKLHVLMSNFQDSKVMKLLQLINEYSKLMKKFLIKIDLLPLQHSKFLFAKELEGLITSAFQMTLSNHKESSTLYISIPQEESITSMLNMIKKNYVSFLNRFLKIFANTYKEPSIRDTNALFSKTPEILTYFITETCKLLKKQPYHKYSSSSQILSVLFETISLIITCLNINNFYFVFQQLRLQIIEQIIIPCLYLAPNDLQDFYDNPIEFIDKTIQIIEKDMMPKNQRAKKQANDEIQLYETIKTNSALCLNILCKYQDGLLSYIIDFILNIFEGKIQSEIPKVVLLLMLPILKNHLFERADIQTRLSGLINQLLEFQTPAFDEKKRFQRDIEYAYVLLVISKIVPEIIQVAPEILSKASKKGIQILSNQGSPDVYKYFMFQFFDQLNILQNGQLFALDIIFIYNSLIKEWNQLSLKLLDSYYLLLEYNIPFFKVHSAPVLEGLTIFCHHIERQLQKPAPVQLIINKSFNIVRLVGESSEFITAEHIKHIEGIMIPFLPYIDGIRDLDIEEDILLLLTSFIRHGKMVTNNQKVMFQVIPNIFYNQYKCHFGHALQTINTFIYYGSVVLQQSPKALQVIAEMSLTNITQKMVKGRPLNDIDNCQGVLILQSLVLACGHLISVQMWTLILQKCVNRLMEPIQSKILSANLLGFICLSLTKTQNIFPDEENEILLTRVISGASICRQCKWTQKILVAGLSELLLSYQKPFVNRRYTQILDTIVSTLSLQKGKPAQEEDGGLYEFQTILQLVENNLKKLDEYNYFKIALNKIKMSQGQLLKSSFDGLSQQKKDYLNRIFLTERVANEPRAIYKIKK